MEMIDETVERYMTSIRESDDPDAATRGLLLDLVCTIVRERREREAHDRAHADQPLRIADALRMCATFASANPGTAMQVRTILDCAEFVERKRGV